MNPADVEESDEEDNSVSHSGGGNSKLKLYFEIFFIV
jgi:hypothetical protein